MMAPWGARFQAFSMAYGVGGFSEYDKGISCRHSAAFECSRRDGKTLEQTQKMVRCVVDVCGNH